MDGMGAERFDDEMSPLESAAGRIDVADLGGTNGRPG